MDSLVFLNGNKLLSRPSSGLCTPMLVGMSHTCVAHWHRPNSQQQLHKCT